MAVRRVPRCNRSTVHNLVRPSSACAPNRTLRIRRQPRCRLPYQLADDTLAGLAESKRFVGLRDGTADLARPLRLRSLVPSSFRLLSGIDATALAYVNSGGDGCISMISNVMPDLCRVIFSNSRQGRLQSAGYLQKRLLPLEACLARESPAALKYALSLLGLMGPATRLPLVELDELVKAAVARAVAEIADEDLVEAAEA